MSNFTSLFSFVYGFLMLYCVAAVGNAFSLPASFGVSIGFLAMIVTTKITLPEGRSISPQSEILRKQKKD